VLVDGTAETSGRRFGLPAGRRVQQPAAERVPPFAHPGDDLGRRRQCLGRRRRRIRRRRLPLDTQRMAVDRRGLPDAAGAGASRTAAVPRQGLPRPAARTKPARAGRMAPLDGRFAAETVGRETIGRGDTEDRRRPAGRRQAAEGRGSPAAGSDHQHRGVAQRRESRTQRQATARIDPVAG